MILGIDYVQMADAMERLSGKYVKLHEEVAGIAGFAQNLDIFWDGDANSAFMEKISEDMVEIGVLTSKIGENIRMLKKVFAIYSANEAQIMMMIGDVR